MKRNDTVIHVELADGSHHYFGSITAIYTTLTEEQVGVKCETLYRHKLNAGNAFTNRKCTIRKGKITRKETNRRPPVKILRVIG